MKKKAPVVRRKRARAKPEPVSLVPAVVENQSVSVEAKPTSAPVVVFQTCAEHPDITYRIGGFCERCYAEASTYRVKQLDDTLQEVVIAKFHELVQRVVDSEDIQVVERFLGRVLSRFERPKEMHVSGTLRAVHLHAPMVDFGKKE